MGSNFARKGVYKKIIIESDAKRITIAIQNRGQDTCKFGHLMDDILLLLGLFPSWEICHVKLEANKAAHGLA
jgi:hypothetical protein